MVVYPFEQNWEILRQIVLQKMPILVKKIIFSDEAHIDLGGYVFKQNCRIWGTHTLKSRHTQNESVFGTAFVSEA